MKKLVQFIKCKIFGHRWYYEVVSVFKEPHSKKTCYNCAKAEKAELGSTNFNYGPWDGELLP